MDTRRYVIIMTALTFLFCAAIVFYNFYSSPPFGAAVASAAPSSFHSAYSSTAAGSYSSSTPVPSSVPSRAVSSSVTESSGPESSAPAASAPPASSGSVTFPLNINTASLEALMELPGIGETLAGRIIEYRNQNGGFQSTDELLNIKGIGQKTYEKIRELVTVG